MSAGAQEILLSGFRVLVGVRGRFTADAVVRLNMSVSNAMNAVMMVAFFMVRCCSC